MRDANGDLMKKVDDLTESNTTLSMELKDAEDKIKVMDSLGGGKGGKGGGAKEIAELTVKLKKWEDDSKTLLETVKRISAITPNIDRNELVIIMDPDPYKFLRAIENACEKS